MLDYDDALEKRINDLENGAPLEDVLKNLTEETTELKDLIRLAAAVRAVPHPEPIAEKVIAQRRAVLAAATRDTIPVARRAAPLPARPKWGWLGMGAAISAAAAFALLLIVTVAAAGFWFNYQKLDTARVETITGQVQIATNRAGTEWKNIATGQRLRRGDRLRTLGASSATLAFYEGTHTFVSANSDLLISELNGSSGKKIQVKIDQKTGETWNKVTPLTGGSSYFLVNTPSGIASVHGTSFSVKVSRSGQAQFLVKSGEVQVKNEASEVTLLAGQATSADPNGAIADPTFQFNTQGSLLEIDKTTGLWNVSGVTFAVLDTTVVTSPVQLGDTVRITGRILEDNLRVADIIELASDSSQTASFTGTLEQRDDAWVIGTQTVTVNEQTELDPNLAVGDPVKVTFNILEDNTWLAVKIESLRDQVDEPFPTPTATSDPRAMPDYEFSTDQLASASCGSRDYNLTGTLKNTASAAKDYAANVQLGYRIEQGGEFVNVVELTPSTWTRIDAGQMVTFNIHVSLKEDWQEDQDANAVKLSISVVSATNRPEHLNGRVAITLENNCEETPDSSVTPPATPETDGGPAIPPTEAIPPAEASPENGLCTGANPHPTGLTLSQRYGVAYEDIMYWFCQHYGFGEIDLAYSLSWQSGKPVAEIFAMRASGAGWGEIKKTLLGGDVEEGSPEKNNDDKNKNDDNNNKNNDNNKNNGNKPGKKKP